MFPNLDEDQNLTIFKIKQDIKRRSVKRFGINLGFHDQFGASQILKNIITNPGFEGGQYATIFLTNQASNGTRVQVDNWNTVWNQDIFGIGQPIGFWDNADYEFVDGLAKGRQGKIRNFQHENNLYTFYLDRSGVWPGEDDVLFVRKEIDGYFGQDDEFNRPDSTQKRPGSSGRQSLRLLPPDRVWQWSYSYYLDSYWRDNDQSAGKLMIVDGKWHLEFWAKSEQADAEIEVRFEREREKTFLNKTFSLSPVWKKYEATFEVGENDDRLGPFSPEDAHRILIVRFRINTAGGGWIDDVSLGRADQENPTVFTDKFVNLLKELNPGIVRNWGKQHGSTLDNQLADQFARKTTGFRPKYRQASNFHFSLHEFLELAQEVDAEPWYVIPPTFEKWEMDALIAYLAAPSNAHPYAAKRAQLGQRQPWTEVFDTIHLEYGNEMWGFNLGGDTFLGATVRGGERLGRISDDRLSVSRNNSYFDDEKFNLIVGGQHRDPHRQTEIETHSDAHNSIAIAPYFGDLEEFMTPEDLYLPLFARTDQDVTIGEVVDSYNRIQALDEETELSIYEINFHTTTNPLLPVDVRNSFVTGLAGGIALPLYMLRYMRDLGVKNQAAFTAAQYSFEMDSTGNRGDYVRLWGLLRDIEGTGLKRPTWLGLKLANLGIQGDMLDTSVSGELPSYRQRPINGILRPLPMPYLHMFAFRDGNDYSAILFNLHSTDALDVCLDLPEAPPRTATLHTMTASAFSVNNETSEKISIETTDVDNLSAEYKLTLPPRSMSVLTWRVFRMFMPIMMRPQNGQPRPE